MNKRLREFVRKTPLLVKVVSLYVVAFVPLHFFVLNPPVRALDTNTYITEIVKTEVTRKVEPETVQGAPKRLRIPSVGINLPIEDGLYNYETDTWTLSRTAVHYAVMTSPPNNKAGNTLIYGHNNRNVLAPTRDIRTGDKLQIVAKDGTVFTYRYVADIKVDPSDTSILAVDPNKPQLTLLTCDGLFYEKRRLMHFEFVEVTKND